jgi:hypothetical protein
MNHDAYAAPHLTRQLLTPTPGAFLLCPIWTCGGQWAWQEPLYGWALSEARAVASPSLLERDLLGVWN